MCGRVLRQGGVNTLVGWRPTHHVSAGQRRGPIGGPGVFDGVTFIQRVNTVGGLPPAEDGAFVGEEARVPYAADDYFYRAAR